MKILVLTQTPNPLRMTAADTVLEFIDPTQLLTTPRAESETK